MTPQRPSRFPYLHHSPATLHFIASPVTTESTYERGNWTSRTRHFWNHHGHHVWFHGTCGESILENRVWISPGNCHGERPFVAPASQEMPWMRGSAGLIECLLSRLRVTSFHMICCVDKMLPHCRLHRHQSVKKWRMRFTGQ